MGGRKVCFIDADGQVGTCIRDDEHCFKCDLVTIQIHFEWQKSEHEQNSKQISEYYTDIYSELYAIEKLVCGIRGAAVVVYNSGQSELYNDLNVKADKIDKITTNLKQLLVELMRKQRADAEYDNQRLKQVLKRIG